jgi:multidrug efflux pump subunit AcrA (membrane-fusion protein)
MTLNKRTILPPLILALGVGGFVALKVTRPKQPAVQVEERAWRVQVQEALPRVLAPTLTLYGQVETPELLKAAAPGEAVVQEVLVKEGDKVSAGQRLLTLDPRDFVPAVEEARAQADELKAQIASEHQRHRLDLRSLGQERHIFELAQAAVARAERLKKQNLGSGSALDEAHQAAEIQALKVTAREYSIADHSARLNRLQALLARARARLEEARLALERSQVIAPFDGIVAHVEVATGDRVRAADVMLSLYAVDSLELRARIPAPYQDELRRTLMAGQAIRGSAGEAVRLRLDRFSGQADPSGIDALFRIEQGREWLRVGEMLAFHIQRPPRAGAFPVPYQAFYGHDRIYLMQDGRMRGLNVEVLGTYLGEDAEEQLLVRSDAVQVGDQIVVTHLPNAVTGLRIEAVR